MSGQQIVELTDDDGHQHVGSEQNLAEYYTGTSATPGRVKAARGSVAHFPSRPPREPLHNDIALPCRTRRSERPVCGERLLEFVRGIASIHIRSRRDFCSGGQQRRHAFDQLRLRHFHERAPPAELRDVGDPLQPLEESGSTSALLPAGWPLCAEHLACAANARILPTITDVGRRARGDQQYKHIVVTSRGRVHQRGDAVTRESQATMTRIALPRIRDRRHVPAARALPRANSSESAGIRWR